MDLSRRQFNRCAAALSGAAALPPLPLPVRSGGDDAYAAMVSELARVEEAAQAAGLDLSRGGAVTVTGKKLEAFLAHMDMQVSPFERGAQVYRELRRFLKDRAPETVRQTGTSRKRSLETVNAGQSGDGVAGEEDAPIEGPSVP